MSSTASKLNNEDTVRRYKEWRRFYAQHHLAVTHSDYCRSLRITGSALIAFAAGEPFAISDHSLAILLLNTTNPTTPRVPFLPPHSSTTTTVLCQSPPHQKTPLNFLRFDQNQAFMHLQKINKTQINTHTK